MSGPYWDQAWNPIRGCTPISPGCANCWARSMHERFHKEPFSKVRCLPEALSKPLHWRKPRVVFIDCADLFHAEVPNEFVAAVFGIMAACPQHTFLVLTKRAKRMRAWFEWIAIRPCGLMSMEYSPRLVCAGYAQDATKQHWNTPMDWPLPNVWLGVTAENQAMADERIPLLLATPAAHRWVSVEPMLGPVDLRGWGDHSPSQDWKSAPERWEDFEWPEWVPSHERKLIEDFWRPDWGRGPKSWLRDHVHQHVPATGARVALGQPDQYGWIHTNKMSVGGIEGRYLHRWNNIGVVVTDDGRTATTSGGSGSGWLSKWLTADGSYASMLDQVVVGSESGRGMRPCNEEWNRSVVRQCADARVSCFNKQIHLDGRLVTDPALFPPDLRVRDLAWRPAKGE